MASSFVTPVKARKNLNSEKIVIPPSPMLNRLGYGTGVSVMELVRSPRGGIVRSPWALKMINKKIKQKTVYVKRLEAEANLLKRMSHPNIVGFREFSKGKILYLGMEACDLSLGDLIEEKCDVTSQPFLPKQILKVAIDIGNALDYVHTKINILHGDIKSYNILVNGEFVICKLCDFGVSLPLDRNGFFDKKTAGPKAVYYGTDIWSAPEVMHGGQITTKSDMFSFGLVFWEMMALMAPHTIIDESEEESVICLDDVDNEFNLANDKMRSKCGTRPEIPANVTEEEYGDPLALFYCCTEQVPQMRPSARHIVLCAEDMMTRNT